jgi:hypothetical protein
LGKTTDPPLSGPDNPHPVLASCSALLLEQLGHDPACFDAYPSVGETLRRLPVTRDLPPPELALIEQVIANH